MVGQVVCKISDFFTIKCQDGLYQCRAGKSVVHFDKAIIVGDYVDFDSEKKYILKIHERKNMLIRPSLANVDIGFIVVSAQHPRFKQLQVDEMIVSLLHQKIKPIIILTKLDLHDDHFSEIEQILNYYLSIDVPVLYKDSHLTELIKPFIIGKTCFLVGQSGVGKSTLLNTFIPGLKIKTDVLSKNSQRGKNTTTHVELYDFGDGQLADSPGFSDFSAEIKDYRQVKDYFYEFALLASNCHFKNCTHLHEPKCEVLAQLNKQENEVFTKRYNSYVMICEKIKKKGEQYDS